MSKYICTGTVVNNKSKDSGVVVFVNKDTGIAVMRNENKFWTDKTSNLNVISYKEVK